MQDKIKVERLENVGWLDSWEKPVNEFLVDMQKVDRLKDQDGSMVDKYKILLEMKEKYGFKEYPFELLKEIFEKDLGRLKDVAVEEVNGYVRLSANGIQVNIRLGFNTGVFLKDEEESVWNSPRGNVTEKHKKMVEVFSEVQEGKKSRWELYKEFIGIEEKKSFNDRVKALYYVYITKGDFHNYMVLMEQFVQDEERALDGEKKDRERRVERARILRETGLLEVLREFESKGVKLERDGMYAVEHWIKTE